MYTSGTMVLSIITLLISVFFFFRAHVRKVFKIIYISSFFISGLFILINLTIVSAVGEIGLEQTLYHLYTDAEMITTIMFDYLLQSLFFILFFIALLCASLVLIKRKSVKARKYFSTFALLFSFLSIFLNQTFQIAFLEITERYITPNNTTLSLFFSESDFKDYYNKPLMKKVADNKNLVFLYMEGLEYSYFDESVFPGLMKDLKEATRISDTYTNIQHAKGTGSTITGFISSQCGLPLVSPSLAYSAEHHSTQNFLPNATCIGDILQKHNYYLSFIGGARANFANKDFFLLSHGFNKIYSKENFLKDSDNQVPLSGWGVYDDFLFPKLKEEFKSLSSKEEPFALFALTLDTHVPSGFPSPSCEDTIYRDGKNRLLNTVHCSQKMIADFVNHITSSEEFEDTVLVLASDHLKQKGFSTSYKNIERTNTFIVLTSEQTDGTKNTTLGSTIDTGITTLSYLGFEGKLALGQNLLNPHRTDEETEKMISRTSKWKKDLSYFWNLPATYKKITIDRNLSQITVDGKKLDSPVLVSFGHDNGVIFRFPGHNSKTDFEAYTKTSKNGYFYIDYCHKVNKNHITYPVDTLCFFEPGMKKPLPSHLLTEIKTYKSE